MPLEMRSEVLDPDGESTSSVFTFVDNLDSTAVAISILFYPSQFCVYACMLYVHMCTKTRGFRLFSGSGPHRVTIAQYLVVWSFDSTSSVFHILYTNATENAINCKVYAVKVLIWLFWSHITITTRVGERTEPSYRGRRCNYIKRYNNFIRWDRP